MLGATTAMVAFDVPGNLMSLGALDFGLIVDGSVVLIENLFRRLAHEDNPNRPMARRVFEAGLEVLRPIVFAIGIIIVVYVPILTFREVEGKMFRPMAITVCSALVGSLIFALTLVPALSSLMLPVAAGDGEGGEHEAGWFVWLRNRYSDSLDWTIEHRRPVLGEGGAAGVEGRGDDSHVGRCRGHVGARIPGMAFWRQSEQ